MPVIEQLLKESKDELSFTFKRGENLEQKSSKIPNSPGNMLVFCKKTSIVFDEDLEYKIKGEDYILCYYGMSSGFGDNQGLKKYITNVTTGDILREKKWKDFMDKNNIDELLVHCILLNNPKETKNKITNSLYRITRKPNMIKDKKQKVKPLMNQNRFKPQK